MSGGITGIPGNKGDGMLALLEKQFLVGGTSVLQLRDSENKFSCTKAWKSALPTFISFFFLITDPLSENNLIFALVFWSEVQGEALQYILVWYKTEHNAAFTGLLEFSSAQRSTSL